MTGFVPPDDPAAVQAGIRATRARLLGGRGPGASGAEIDRHTRARPQLAGEPTPQHLEVLARQTAVARGDAAAIALDVAAARDQLAGNLQAIRERVSPARIAERQARAGRATVAAGWTTLRDRRPTSVAAGAAVALTVAAVLLVTRRRSRRSPLVRREPGSRSRRRQRRRRPAATRALR